MAILRAWKPTDGTWGAAVARAKVLLVTAREAIEATRNQRHIAVLRRALHQKADPKK